MTDPRIVPNPRTISKISYRELRELSYMGASVLHEDSDLPVQKSGIPINVKNTNDPEHPGTMIFGRAGGRPWMHHRHRRQKGLYHHPSGKGL